MKIFSDAAYATFYAGSAGRRPERPRCKRDAGTRPGRDSVFYLNDVKGEPPRLESGLGSRPSASTSLTSSSSPCSLFPCLPPRAFTHPPIFALSFSLERAKSDSFKFADSAAESPSASIISALLCRRCRVMLHSQCAFTFRGENVDTVSCVSSHWLFST